MPYGVFKQGADEKPYCVYKTDADGGPTGDNLGCHPTEDKAAAQIQAIGASTHSVGDYLSGKAKFGGIANAGGLLEGKVHEHFTTTADALYQAGVITRDERIALSGAIGKSLEKLSKVIEGLALFERPLPQEFILGIGQGVKMIELDTDGIVNRGGPLKALGNGRVGGYLIMFSKDETDVDLTGDWFWTGTKFVWSPRETRPVLYHHGLDEKLGKTFLGSGWTQVKVDEVGLWVETQLKMRDEYEAAVYGLATKRRKDNRPAMGLSSGTANHMIEKQPNGRIDLWPVIEGSFTPTPADPREQHIRSIKSVQPYSLQALLRGSGLEGAATKRMPVQRDPGVAYRSTLGTRDRVLRLVQQIHRSRNRR